MRTQAAADGPRQRARVRRCKDDSTRAPRAPKATPSPDFALQVRRLAGQIWRERRPVDATAAELAAWDEANSTSRLFREALLQLQTPVSPP